jgi:methionine-rich copper-binding protein CopC
MKKSMLSTIFVLVALFAAAALIQAHAKIEKSEPAANSTIATVPTSVQMWFNEAPDLKVTKVELAGASGKVELGPAHSMGKNNVMAPIVGKMTNGKYTVSWQTAGDDGHVEKGTFTFTLSTKAE